MKKPKIAIVADWLTSFGGAESVIESFAQTFEDAPIYTTVFVNERFKLLFKEKIVRTSYLQKLPKFIRKNHRILLPFLPKAIESLDLSDFDIVLSSSSFVAKGVITNPNTLHICYCHTPARFLWDQPHQYLKNFPMPNFFKPFISRIFFKLRIWDKVSADRVDFFIANSDFTKNKITKMWRKESVVISPPVDFENFKKGLKLKNTKEKDYYLWVGRLVSQKNIELLISTFNKTPEKKLKIAGVGHLEKKLKKMAINANNIEFLGFVENKDLPRLYANAKAIIFPQIEDAGIVPLESLSAGTPIIAYKKGGVLTTLNKKVCVFFENQTVEDLKNALEKIEKNNFQPNMLNKWAEQFSKENFEKKIINFINEKWKDFCDK